MALPENITPELVEQFRQIVDAHDKEQGDKKIGYVNINEVKVPYLYRPFPKLVYAPDYDHEAAGMAHTHQNLMTPAIAGMVKQVANEAELKEALAAGFLEKPPAAKPKVEAEEPVKSPAPVAAKGKKPKAE